MEECTEVAHRISKGLRFGMEQVQPNQTLDNRTRVIYEFNDLMTVMGLLGLATLHPETMHTKLTKLEKYIEYSQRLGLVSDGHVPVQLEKPAHP